MRADLESNLRPLYIWVGSHKTAGFFRTAPVGFLRAPSLGVAGIFASAFLPHPLDGRPLPIPSGRRAHAGSGSDHPSGDHSGWRLRRGSDHLFCPLPTIGDLRIYPRGLPGRTRQFCESRPGIELTSARYLGRLCTTGQARTKLPGFSGQPQ